MAMHYCLPAPPPFLSSFDWSAIIALSRFAPRYRYAFMPGCQPIAPKLLPFRWSDQEPFPDAHKAGQSRGAGIQAWCFRQVQTSGVVIGTRLGLVSSESCLEIGGTSSYLPYRSAYQARVAVEVGEIRRASRQQQQMIHVPVSVTTDDCCCVQDENSLLNIRIQ